MPTQSGLATQGKKTHEDRMTSTASQARSKFRDGKPENRVGMSKTAFGNSVDAAAKLVSGLGKG